MPDRGKESLLDLKFPKMGSYMGDIDYGKNVLCKGIPIVKLTTFNHHQIFGDILKKGNSEKFGKILRKILVSEYF